MNNLSNLVVYNDGELELKVSVDSDTVWLSQNQLCELFDRDKSVISRHIKNVFTEREVDKLSTVANFATVQIEGDREVTRDVEYYNLDVIISIGYRVKSQKGVRFRQWATSILKNYIQNGYVINSDKITHERFVNLEKDVDVLKYEMSRFNSLIKNNALEFKQKIFYDGQIFDSYSFINDLLKTAKQEIILIDNYIDETVFTLFSKYPNINFSIYTNNISKQLSLDYEKYSKQYRNITLKTFKNAHDRFIIIDKIELYHLGASLKDVGKKWFAFSKMSLDSVNLDEILEKL